MKHVPRWAHVPMILSALFLVARTGVPSAGAAPAEHDPDGAVLEITRSGYDRIDGSVRFDAPAVEAVDTPAGRFDRIRLVGTTPTRGIGRPELPVLRRTIEVPVGAVPALLLSSLRTETVSARDVGATHRILPVQPPVPKVPGARGQMEFVLDVAAYASDRYDPEGPARIVESGMIRGHAYVTVEFHPVRYNPARGRFALLTSAEFKIALPGARRAATEAALDRYESGPFERILSSLLVNHGDFHGGPPSPLLLPPPLGLLIVAPDEYESDVLAYANWKRSQGYSTTIARLSETGSGKYDIRNYIQNAYETWEIPPTYVLLMGDTNLVPTFDGSTGNHVTDLKYGGVLGRLRLHVLGRGRFPGTPDVRHELPAGLHDDRRDDLRGALRDEQRWHGPGPLLLRGVQHPG